MLYIFSTTYYIPFYFSLFVPLSVLSLFSLFFQLAYMKKRGNGRENKINNVFSYSYSGINSPSLSVSFLPRPPLPSAGFTVLRYYFHHPSLSTSLPTLSCEAVAFTFLSPSSRTWRQCRRWRRTGSPFGFL